MYDAKGRKENSNETMILANAPLVGKIARKLSSRLPSSVSIDDLIQSGMLGLMDTVATWDPSKNVPFEAYATLKIKGAMLDELRKCDWLPKSTRSEVKKLEEAENRLSQKLGREPSEGELAEFMSVPIKDVSALIKDGFSGSVLNLEAMVKDDDGSGDIVERIASGDSTPEELLEKKVFNTNLTQAIDALEEKERIVLSLYYEEELNLKEIGLVLGVSESRVCQILSKITKKLGTSMREWKD